MPKQKSTITKEEEEIRDQLLEIVPNCEFSHIKRMTKPLYVFKSIKGKSYKCPACNVKHKESGWYAFERGDTIMAGCYSKKFDKKNSKVLIKLEGYVELDLSDSESDDSESDDDVNKKYSIMDALSSDEEEEDIKLFTKDEKPKRSPLRKIIKKKQKAKNTVL